jgi:hypothetical protein
MMRDEIEITGNELSGFLRTSSFAPQVDGLVARLERDGIVVLPELLQPETLRAMQETFASRLRRPRWNNFDGYQKTEPYRHMVEDVLLLDQGFVDLVLHPLVTGILNRYLGDEYELTEAKGWKSLPTKRDFHGWHGDAWYDQTQGDEIHKEVKLAIYLSDVHSGAFNYIKGSHRKQHPRLVKNAEVGDADASQLAELLGSAGTAFLFDTSGIHRQGVPMLEERQACFFNYHNPRVALQQEDVDYYRYHPLILNAAFLGGLTEQDQRILGFGNKTNFQPAFARAGQPSIFGRALSAAHSAELRVRQLRERIQARVLRMRNRT